MLRNSKRILLVEDNQELREFLRDYLASYYLVSWAVDGKAAWEILNSNSYDLVVSDVEMPEMDGQSLAKRLSITHPHLPIILMTGWPTLVGTSQANIVCVLTKPFSPEDLVEKIREIFSSKRE